MRKIELPKDFAKALESNPPTVAVVLGTALDFVSSRFDTIAGTRHADVFPFVRNNSLAEHPLRIRLCRHNGVNLLLFIGRIHLYEGYPAEQVAMPVMLMHELGVKRVILLNSAGSLNKDMPVGTVMAISDHIHLLTANPLLSPMFAERKEAFPDLSELYCPRMRAKAKEIASAKGTKMGEGVYICMLGPSYETPAEVRALRILGADAVGMSTTIEAIAARALGMRVCALSCLMNMGVGLSDERVTEGLVHGNSTLFESSVPPLVEGLVAMES